MLIYRHKQRLKETENAKRKGSSQTRREEGQTPKKKSTKGKETKKK